MMTGSDEVRYVLQVAEEMEVDVNGDGDGERRVEPEIRTAWFDVATVSVPPRTKHVTAMRKAAKDAGLEIPEAGLRVRLLDAATADPTTLLPPAPQPGPREVRL